LSASVFTVLLWAWAFLLPLPPFAGSLDASVGAALEGADFLLPLALGAWGLLGILSQVNAILRDDKEIVSSPYVSVLKGPKKFPMVEFQRLSYNVGIIIEGQTKLTLKIVAKAEKIVGGILTYRLTYHLPGELLNVHYICLQIPP
jgi:hypothetical protein